MGGVVEEANGLSWRLLAHRMSLFFQICDLSFELRCQPLISVCQGAQHTLNSTC